MNNNTRTRYADIPRGGGLRLPHRGILWEQRARVLHLFRRGLDPVYPNRLRLASHLLHLPEEHVL